MEHEDVILNEMEETRTSLAEKLETLESKVSETVSGATTNVKETVEAVTDTVSTVKDTVRETVEETVNSVKESVQETVNSVKETVSDSVHAVQDFFNVPRQVDRHPWAMMAGSVGLGYVLGTYLGAPAHSGVFSNRRASPSSYAGPSKQAFVSGSGQSRGGNGHHREAESSGLASGMASAASSAMSGAMAAAPGLLGTLFRQFEPEINRLKGMAIGMVMDNVRDMVLRSVPPHLTEPVNDLLNSVTEKVGGQSLHGGHGSHQQGHGDHWSHRQESGDSSEGVDQEKDGTEGD